MSIRARPGSETRASEKLARAVLDGQEREAKEMAAKIMEKAKLRNALIERQRRERDN